MRLYLADIHFKNGPFRTFNFTTKTLYERPEVLELHNSRVDETLLVILQHAVTVEITPVDGVPAPAVEEDGA